MCVVGAVVSCPDFWPAWFVDVAVVIYMFFTAEAP